MVYSVFSKIGEPIINNGKLRNRCNRFFFIVQIYVNEGE